MSGIKITTITPTYNSGRHIKRCIDSILRQDYKNIEIIIVDDGSTDETVRIVEEYMRHDPRIQLIRQGHQGPNKARWAGVLKATGDYTMFVDSDDYLENDALSILIDKLKRYGVNSIRFDGCYNDTTEKVQPILEANEESKIISNSEIMKLLLTTFKLNSLWSQIYRTDILKRAKAFQYDLTLGEDFLVNLEIHQNTQKMLIIGKKPLYHYCDNPDSTTHSKNRKQMRKNIRERIVVSRRAIAAARRIHIPHFGRTVSFQTKAILSLIKNYFGKTVIAGGEKK